MSPPVVKTPDSRCRSGRTRRTSAAPAAPLEVFHRLGVPVGFLNRKWTAPEWLFSSSQRPSGRRFARTRSIASASRGSGVPPRRGRSTPWPSAGRSASVGGRRTMPTAGSTTSPVRNDRKRLRRSKYSSPFRRARRTSSRSTPVSRSHLSRASITSRVLAKDAGAGRVSAQQFQPPSGIWSATRLLRHHRVTVDAQVCTDQDRAGVDAAVHLAGEERQAVVLPAAVAGHQV